MTIFDKKMAVSTQWSAFSPLTYIPVERRDTESRTDYDFTAASMHRLAGVSKNSPLASKVSTPAGLNADC
jgi:hypothetical protein